MSIISRLVPDFLRDPAVALIGEVITCGTRVSSDDLNHKWQKCYASLVEEFNVSDADCLKLAVSKALGIGIVVGGSIMKLPQILISRRLLVFVLASSFPDRIVVLSAKSARGLSLSAYALETSSYAITTVYAQRHHYPISTYGENFFLSVQNVFITLLIIYYSQPRLAASAQTKSAKLIAAAVLVTFGMYALYAVPTTTLQGLQILTVPLSVLSKLPQISQNYRAQSTGQLSAFAVLSQIAGCLARVFTTSTEVGDFIVLVGFLVALGLNLVLGAQMWLYWDKQQEDISLVEQNSSVLPQQNKDDFISPGTLSHQSSLPRRWARKVD
jgi:mannose-P-dolichol utilization defect protein 1